MSVRVYEYGDGYCIHVRMIDQSAQDGNCAATHHGKILCQGTIGQCLDAVAKTGNAKAVEHMKQFTLAMWKNGRPTTQRILRERPSLN